MKKVFVVVLTSVLFCSVNAQEGSKNDSASKACAVRWAKPESKSIYTFINAAIAFPKI
ncbi:MAG TPA: hypothetical protein VMT76_01490 [Puia sp.]|nr:hypothetical protein [Puia sp.]